MVFQASFRQLVLKRLRGVNMDLKFDDLEKYITNNDHEKLNGLWKLLKLRFNYSWNAFEFHAKQRISMFNFFILFAGITANAIANLLRANLFVPAGILAFIGGVVSIVFIFFDRRNEELVHFAEDNLRELERDIVFINYQRDIEWPRRRTLFGRMNKKIINRQLGIHLRESEDIRDKGRSHYEHGRWIPILQFLIAIGCFIAAYWLLKDYLPDLPLI
jgi:hypothetical protein